MRKSVNPTATLKIPTVCPCRHVQCMPLSFPFHVPLSPFCLRLLAREYINVLNITVIWFVY